MKLVYYFIILFGITQLNTTLILNKCQKKGNFALMFYGAPNSSNERILDILDQKKVKATFFYNSNAITDDNQKRVCKRTFMQGHQIGLLASGFNYNEIEKDLNNGQMELTNIIQFKTNLIILDSLNNNLKVKNKLTEAGYNLINDIILFDKTQKENFNQIKSNQLIQKELQSLDSSENSYIYSQSMISPNIPFLNELINTIKVKKYKFVSLSECFSLSNPYQILSPINTIKASRNEPSQISTLGEDPLNTESKGFKEKMIKKGSFNNEKEESIIYTKVNSLSQYNKVQRRGLVRPIFDSDDLKSRRRPIIKSSWENTKPKNSNLNRYHGSYSRGSATPIYNNDHRYIGPPYGNLVNLKV